MEWVCRGDFMNKWNPFLPYLDYPLFFVISETRRSFRKLFNDILIICTFTIKILHLLEAKMCKRNDSITPRGTANRRSRWAAIRAGSKSLCTICGLPEAKLEWLGSSPLGQPLGKSGQHFLTGSVYMDFAIFHQVSTKHAERKGGYAQKYKVRHGHLVKFHPFSSFFVYGPGCSVCLYTKGAKRRISLPML